MQRNIKEGVKKVQKERERETGIGRQKEILSVGERYKSMRKRNNQSGIEKGKTKSSIIRRNQKQKEQERQQVRIVE